MDSSEKELSNDMLSLGVPEEILSATTELLKVTGTNDTEDVGNNSTDELFGVSKIDTGTESILAGDIGLPSNVTDREEIFMPPDIEIDDPRIYGKWLVFTNGDLNFQDYMWTELQTLLCNGNVILVASSTAKLCPDRSFLQGVIKCYTCKDIKVIKHAGIAIHNIMNKDIILNYKTNEASKGGLYRGRGYKFVTKYMLTVNGELYEKDKLERWRKVMDMETEESAYKEAPNTANDHIYQCLHSRQFSDSQLLPSQERKRTRYIYPSYSELMDFSGMWYLFCNAVNIDNRGMTELDYTWLKARALFDEGFFISVSCETIALKPKRKENRSRRSVTCELKDFRNIADIIHSGDKLRERISYNFPMYMKICCHDKQDVKKYHLKYMYTDDRELYEYVEKCWKLFKRDDVNERIMLVGVDRECKTGQGKEDDQPTD